VSESSDLQRLIKMAETMVAQKAVVEQLTEQLKAESATLLRFEREDLPNLMTEVGLRDLTLLDGSVITIKEDCSASITDRTRGPALNWLASNGFGGLIKTQVSVAFARGSHDEAVAVRDQLSEQYDGVELKEEVHPSTLKSFVKEQLAAGKPLPMDLFNVYPYNKAIISKKGA
jgi:hypothetical protein